MFQDWDFFYALIGAVSGALVSLLFVVATLTTSSTGSGSNRGINVFMTPVVFHFAVVIALSATALAPRLPAILAEVAVGACAITGLVHMLVIGLQFRRKDFQIAHWSDFWCYVAAPGLLYLAIGATAICLRFRTDVALQALGLILVVLMLTAIRNAWDLVTWPAPRAPRAASDGATGAPSP